MRGLCSTILHWCFALSSIPIVYASSLGRRNSTGLTDSVTWDSHSLSIFGQRTFILSAEIHPWRQPNPNLWKDIFQKVKANGFNTVSFYINWALHFPTPNSEPDFQTGTYRDLQLFIDEAHSAGLWLIARPGPYINGETTGGGFPGWVGNIAGSLRTDNTNYTQAWTPYMTSISRLLAKNQITNGGPIILVQAESEFSVGTDRSPYMQAIIDTFRTNGIVVPITFNDQHAGQAGNFSPDLGGEGAVNIYCGDSYPQGSSSWAQVQAIYYSAHQAVAPSNPLCLAEFGGGFLLSWGATARGGTGYEKYTVNLTNAEYENVFYKENYAQTATILNVYMLYGGTNWGQTLEPTVYSSYDYGGGINENRILTPKMPEMRLQGNCLFLRTSRDILSANLIANGTNYTTSPIIHTAELRNLDTNAGFYIIRHNASTSTQIDTTRLNVSTSVGDMLVPSNGDITLNGRESKIIVTDYVFGISQTRILYSTAEIMTWTTIDNDDHLILYAPSGQTGETSLSFMEEPRVDLNGASNVQFSWTGGFLRLNYVLSGSAFVDIQAGHVSLRVIVLDKDIANTWHVPVVGGPGTFANYYSIGTNQTVLVGGPYLVRDASVSDSTLSLTGDVNETTTVEVFAPSVVQHVIWNNQKQIVSRTSHRSIRFTARGPSAITLPSLGPWKVLNSLPEVQQTFDDSDFVTADLTETNYTNLPPLAGDKVLYSQQYGFFGGNLLFRGHFNASGAEAAFNLTVQGGVAFGYSAFLNGVFLGSKQGSPTVSVTTDVWSIPNGTLDIGQDNVLTLFQDHMGIVETNTNGGKEPRGIRGYSIIGGNSTFSSWKLQGNLGGSSHNPDKYRGYLNEGGLYAERIGAHLPQFDDHSWKEGSPLEGVKGAGVNFYRTSFSLHASDVFTDTPVRLSITPSVITSNFRAQIYINGWQVGKYINNIGPQTIFVLPSGLLRRQSQNTLAISLWSLDSSGASIAGLELISDGVFRSSLEFADYTDAPDYLAQKSLRPKPIYFGPTLS